MCARMQQDEGIIWVLSVGVSTFQVYLCGNSGEAKQAVAEVATKLGLSVLNRGSLTAARELEDFPLELFPEWRLPLRLTLGLTASFYFYVLLRDVVYTYVTEGTDISFRIMVSLANKVKACRAFVSFSRMSYAGAFLLNPFSALFQVFPIVSLILLALCYLPGVIAAFLQLYRGTKYKSEPMSTRAEAHVPLCT